MLKHLKRVVAAGERGGEDAKDEEGLSRGLVLDVVCDGVLEEGGELEVDLGDDETEEDEGVVGLAHRGEVGSDTKLGDVDRPNADPLGLVDSKLDGERHEAHGAVPLDRLEVVDNGDSQAGERVQGGEDGHGGVERLKVEEALAAPPGERDVGGAQSVVSDPPALFHRFRAQYWRFASFKRDSGSGEGQFCRTSRHVPWDWGRRLLYFLG
jgi:hypothetical protein